MILVYNDINFIFLGYGNIILRILLKNPQIEQAIRGNPHYHYIILRIQCVRIILSFSIDYCIKVLGQSNKNYGSKFFGYVAFLHFNSQSLAKKGFIS